MAKVFEITEPGFSSEHLYKGFLQRDIDFAKSCLARMEKENNQKDAEKYKWLTAILMWYYFDQKVACGYKFTETKFGQH